MIARDAGQRAMILRRMAPHPRLAGVVRHYQQRTAAAGEPDRRIALPARSEVLLEFYFTAPHLLELQASGVRERAPMVAAVGPQTHRRVDLLLMGRMDIFTVHFTPTGLFELLGVPLPAVTNAGVDAAALIGGAALRAWQERLADAPDLPARVAITDAALLARAGARPRDALVAAALARIGRGGGETGALAAAAGLSPRQFRRRFEQAVGVAPKLYARIVRMEAALAARRADPGRSWTDLAHAGGWFDQAHMDKDFRDLAGVAPSRLTPPPVMAVPY